MTVACRLCGEPFTYWEEGTKGWIPRQPVDIRCPHCGGAHGSLQTIGYVYSRKLTPDQRAAWDAEQDDDAD